MCIRDRCTSTSEVVDHNGAGSLEKGLRQMRVFKTSIARFVTCYTSQSDGGPLRCIKQKRIGACNAYFMRNAAFDSRAVHIASPSTNSTGLDWDAETKKWDATALNKGKSMLQPGAEMSIGLSSCDTNWKERLVALM
eukprot:TRINITY_DN26120_c0_g1_i1.p1 TRINITY_DN26120_c0_g1~~TRINITY_DN26120_c0_g1_i1.p1  ORF type:complete len:137 (+),score=26.67 TRINITY_DN26120_c0_g1_i1:190-600(+)